MEKWIYELILSVITVAGTIIALVQTRQQMRLSNKQALFKKRLNTYMFVKGLMELCNSNKAHFREYRDDVRLSSNTIIFCFLTNNSYLSQYLVEFYHPRTLAHSQSFFVYPIQCPESRTA